MSSRYYVIVESIIIIYHQLQITSTTVEVILGEWMKEAGIEKDFTYHSNRHTTATLAITAGADFSAVKEMLGHISLGYIDELAA